MYKTECPKCSGPLFVVSFTAATSIPLCRDGFSPMDAKGFDTEDEIVECADCDAMFGLSELSVED